MDIDNRQPSRTQNYAHYSMRMTASSMPKAHSGRHGHTGALELLRREHVAGEDHLHGAALADLTDEALRAAEAGNHADLNLRLPELGLLARVDDVERHRDLAAAAELSFRNSARENI